MLKDRIRMRAATKCGGVCAEGRRRHRPVRNRLAADIRRAGERMCT